MVGVHGSRLKQIEGGEEVLEALGGLLVDLGEVIGMVVASSWGGDHELRSFFFFLVL
jgi:hypothetical protein